MSDQNIRIIESVSSVEVSIDRADPGWVESVIPVTINDYDSLLLNSFVGLSISANLSDGRRMVIDFPPRTDQLTALGEFVRAYKGLVSETPDG